MERNSKSGWDQRREEEQDDEVVGERRGERCPSGGEADDQTLTSGRDVLRLT